MSGRWGPRLLAVAVFILYNSWLAWPLNGNPQILRGYLSELAALDQPYSWFFRLGDALAALVIALIAWLGRQRWEPWLGAWARRLSMALFLAAGATLLDVVFALPCAESHDSVCAATPSLTRQLHALTSGTVGVAFLLSFVCVAWGLRAGRGWDGAARSCLALGAVAGVLMLHSALAPWTAPGTQGPVQALQVMLCSLWVAALAWSMSMLPAPTVQTETQATVTAAPTASSS